MDGPILMVATGLLLLKILRFKTTSLLVCAGLVLAWTNAASI